MRWRFVLLVLLPTRPQRIKLSWFGFDMTYLCTTLRCKFCLSWFGCGRQFMKDLCANPRCISLSRFWLGGQTMIYWSTKPRCLNVARFCWWRKLMKYVYTRPRCIYIYIYQDFAVDANSWNMYTPSLGAYNNPDVAPEAISLHTTITYSLPKQNHAIFMHQASVHITIVTLFWKHNHYCLMQRVWFWSTIMKYLWTKP